MCFKPTVTLAVICFTFLCLYKNIEGKALREENTDDIEDDDLVPREFYRLLTKRSVDPEDMRAWSDQDFQPIGMVQSGDEGAWSKRDIQPIGMATWSFCYRMKNRHPLCVNRNSQSTPKIILSRV